jgi:hypothetical protein
MDLATALRSSGALTLKTDIKVADAYAFNGGLNIMDPPSMVLPGQLLGVLNYEPGVRGGYRRWDGYERFSGQPSPSQELYISLAVGTGYNPAPGVVCTESGSGATGVVAYVDVINSVLVLVLVTGTFIGKGSTITSSAGTTTSIGTPGNDSGITTALTTEYELQKYLYFQSFIGPVGGAASSGPVLGAHPYLDYVYAFRNNAAGTAVDMWQSSNSGWVKIELGTKVYFDTGIYSDGNMDAPAEGTFLTGATSGATMTVKRINAMTGTWGTDAAGYFIVASITGTPVAGEALQVAGVTYMNYLSSAAQVIPPGGYYKFRTYNFNAVQNPITGFRLYGINGVGNGFEYDQVTNTFVLIETGNSPDIPTNLEVHASYLFYSFAGGSLQNSGYQLPLNWNAVFGASMRLVGEDVTFLREDISQTLIIGTRRRLWTLTGISVELFQIQIYSPNAGSVANTDENPGQIVFMEDRGFTSAAATSQYGNFEAQSLSDLILSLIPDLVYGDTPVGAVTTRQKNLYRLMFASGTVMCLGMNAAGKFSGWTSGEVVHVPSGFWGGYIQDVAHGVQVEFACMGDVNGYVYAMDRGNSFDGQNIMHFLRLAYDASKSPDTFKRYRRIQVDLSPEGPMSLSMSVDYDYGNRSGQVNQSLDFNGNGGFWDVALWDEFIWDAAQYAQAIMKVEGEGYNIGLFFAGNSNTDAASTIYGASLQWSPRIINRNTGNQ